MESFASGFSSTLICKELDTSIIEFHLKKKKFVQNSILLNIGNIEFYTKLSFHNIKFQKSRILPNNLETVPFC